MSDEAVEIAASILARLLPNAVSIHFDGEACTAKWPADFGPHEQAAYRLVARALLSAAMSAPDVGSVQASGGDNG